MRRFWVIGLGLVFAVAAVSAQNPAPPAGAGAPGQRGAGAPAGGGRGGGRGAPYMSAEIADGKITLRYSAPNAQQVTASGELDGKSHPMTKGDNGIWSVTIGPLPPDIYTYSFSVDNVVALDPRNTNTKMGYGGFGPVSV